jgi:hypothetical protein
VLVSAQDERRLAHQSGSDVTVLPENLAAGLELATQLLVTIGLNRNEVAAIVHTVRTHLTDGPENPAAPPQA